MGKENLDNSDEIQKLGKLINEKLIKEEDIDDLEPDVLFWFAKAIAGSVVVDGVVTEKELTFLSKALEFLDDYDKSIVIINAARDKTLPEIEKINLPKEPAARLYMVLLKILVSDYKITDEEKAFMKEIGGKLGFDSKAISKMMAFSFTLLEAERTNRKIYLKEQEIIKQICG